MKRTASTIGVKELVRPEFLVEIRAIAAMDPLSDRAGRPPARAKRAKRAKRRVTVRTRRRGCR